MPSPYLNSSLEDAVQMSQDSWRIIRIMAEFASALETLKGISPAVSMFGSARVLPNSPYYELAKQTALLLSEAGFSVITGGGPGIMEAGNLGAFNGRSPSVGLNIKLPHEQCSNDYQNISYDFNHFFSRKYMFVRFAVAYVVLPGGFGTLDELMEALTLMQTGRTRKMPMILMGSSFWAGMLDWICERLVVEGMISPDDMNLLQVSDSPEGVIEIIFKFYDDRSFSLNPDEFDELYHL